MDNRIRNLGLRIKNNRNPYLLILLFVLLIPQLVFASHCFAAKKTIGVIMTGDIPYYRDMENAFVSKLSRDGYLDNVDIIIQRPYPDPISLSNAARKLIALDVDIIVAYGAPAVIAVLREKTTIPVVYTGVYEPLTLKIRAKNITGTSSRISISSLLRYLKGMRTITTLGVIYSTNEEDSIYQMEELLRFSNQYGFKIEKINLRRPQDAKLLLSGKRFDAIFITTSSIANMASYSIMDFSRDYRIPTASLLPDKSSHAIITLYASPKELGEKAAEKVIKILNGTPPERIQADSSSNTELVFNLKETIAMGLRIPMELTTEATKLIQ